MKRILYGIPFYMYEKRTLNVAVDGIKVHPAGCFYNA